MLASTIQLPQQHPTNTNQQSHNSAANASRKKCFTLEHHHTHNVMTVVVPKPNSMPKSTSPRSCPAPASTYQPPHNRATSQYYQQPTTITDQDHINTSNRMPNMICLMFHPRSHTTNTHNRHQYQMYVKLCISMRYVNLLRKEVIQPHLPLRLPCYDLVPITGPTFDGSSPKGLGHRLRVLPTFVT